MNYNDIRSHLANGGDPQVLLDAFLKEINAADQELKAEAEAEMKKKAEAEAAAKKAAEKKAKAAKEEARKAAIDAAMAYYALVYPEFSAENLEEFSKTAIDSVAKSIEMVKKLEEGKFTSIFDIFG